MWLLRVIWSVPLALSEGHKFPKVFLGEGLGVKRFKWIGDTLNKVFSPNLEKALTFLDDKLLPATSNAVERGNRRHRKMQKRVYRVRSKVCLEERIALDMILESHGPRAVTKPLRHYTRHAEDVRDPEALLQSRIKLVAVKFSHKIVSGE